MLNSFRKFIVENHLLQSGDRILLAVSGGIDSMVMSHLFLQSDFRPATEFGIAHCNFTLRDVESDKDEILVRQFAEVNNLPFYSKRFDTELFAAKNSMSIQMAARDLRYLWFEEIINTCGFNKVAVAHNLNDNIETLLINLSRGTGIAGLTGMRPSINKIIRPLLFATRDEITQYCLKNSVSYREDMSNADTKYIRNKIRHKVIPILKEINPSIETTLNDTSERFYGINEIVTDYISKLMIRISEDEGEYIVFHLNLLKKHIHNKTILYELFKHYGISNMQLNDLVSVIKGKTGGQLITSSHRIVKNRNEILVSTESHDIIKKYIINNLNDLLDIPVVVSASVQNINENYVIPTDPSVACIDADKISFPLIIRKWEAGDFFYPLGMKQKKKLSDYFIDNKYSILEKENKLILENNGKIVWIIGDRLDNRFKIRNITKQALIIDTLRKPFIIKPVR